VKGWEKTLEPAVACRFTVAFTTAAPLAALRVIVTELESWLGRLMVAGLKVAVTPLGRAEPANV
jgi:hypothetical protein